MIHLDFETRGSVELRGSKSVGIYNYIRHPETEPLMLNWAPDNEPVTTWRIWENEPMPVVLRERLEDPSEPIDAFNSTFERYCFQFKLGITLPPERFQDPQASARYLSLPGDLEDVSTILGLPKDYAKDKRGKHLIDLFCKPHQLKKKRGETAIWQFSDWNTHPVEWEEFIEYGRQDVVAEREVMRREGLLGVWPLPPLERRIWVFDQKVNDRGLPVDRDFITKAYALAQREKREKIDLNNEKTGLDNSNSNTQMLEWVLERGYKGLDPEVQPGDPEYPKYSLNKDVVKSEMKNNPNLTPLCREVLEIRKTTSSTSYKKMSAMLQRLSPDDRIHNLFLYMGSSRCGRWSSTGIQFHNFARPTEFFEDMENVDEARALIYAMDYDGIKQKYADPVTGEGSVLLTVKSLIRTAFVAARGDRFNVSDLNAIETRVGAWVAGCHSLLNGFRNIKDFDPYMDFAMKMTQIPYEILMRDKKSKDPAIRAKAKHHRQIAKPGVLGCIYRMSAATLLDYAEKMGVVMTLKEAELVVKIFRQAYKEIVDMWTTLEVAVADVLNGERTTREVGPNGCIKIDKFMFDCGGTFRTILRIKLPSGRYIHYMDAAMAMTKMPWKDRETSEDVYRMAFNYASQDQTTKQWLLISSHGGKIFENIVQGIARDVLAEKLLMFEEWGLPVVGHVHDEGLCETDDDPFSPGAHDMEILMSKPIHWAPELPLAAEAFESSFYHK